ncbi:UNVERIFIED_CONTAM: hypothetical protein GTU68_061407 [Idotea baltica]|nr:hypothetical protein [Idotea baltica]
MLGVLAAIAKHNLFVMVHTAKQKQRHL